MVSLVEGHGTEKSRVAFLDDMGGPVCLYLRPYRLTRKHHCGSRWMENCLLPKM